MSGYSGLTLVANPFSLLISTGGAEITDSRRCVDLLTVERARLQFKASTQDRDVKAYNLNDVIAAGYIDTSPAYEFCRVYFSQKNKASYVLLKARYVGESLVDAFLKDSSGYSFVCVDSKIVSEIIAFSNFMLGKSKLFLYSGDTK